MTPKQLAERYGFMLSDSGIIHLPDFTQHILSVSQKETFLHIYLDSVYLLVARKEVYPKGLDGSVMMSRKRPNIMNSKACVIMIEGI